MASWPPSIVPQKNEITEPLRKRLQAELTGEETPEAVEKRVRALVRERVGLERRKVHLSKVSCPPRRVLVEKTIRRGSMLAGGPYRDDSLGLAHEVRRLAIPASAARPAPRSSSEDGSGTA